MKNLSNHRSLTNPNVLLESPNLSWNKTQGSKVVNLLSKRTQTFRYEITPYLKDSNSYGNIYFSRYFEWQGVCREKWFTECIYSNMFDMESAFLTKAAHNSYKEEVLPFQTIVCLLNIKNLKHTSFDLVFRFYNKETEVLVSTGYQTVVFIDSTDKRIKKLSQEVIEKVKKFEAQNVCKLRF